MSDFTYELPDERVFLHTLRSYFDSVKNVELASLLLGSRCHFATTSSFSHRRWNSYDYTFILYVKVDSLHKFNDDLKSELFKAVDVVFPKEAGYDLCEVIISPLLEAPPDDDELLQNSGTLQSSAPIEYDGLRFRSKTEIKVYDELKKRDVLFFANSTAILGNKGIKREPDFLICQNGNWGILEVMGDQYHTGANAMKDHDRARLFKDYGLFFIEFYDAVKCYNYPDKVVADFLLRLSKVKSG
ncbi:MAG: hypothetical protein WCZ90_00660 [Melioribacteraceae bacterium]